MGGQKFQYDESGGTFFYFLLSFLALILIPATWYYWPRKVKQDPDKENKECQCPNCVRKKRLLTSSEPWRGTKNALTQVLIITGWILLALLAYKVSQFDYEMANFDPYEILGIPVGASTKDIRQQYKKLSLILHPDKETGNEKDFMKLTKAYQALTDEEAKRNWEKYGNPDGPGAMSFGIALPSWIVEKENSVWVLGLYALVFMVALPTVVGTWWYRSIRFSGDQVLLDTTQMYYYYFHKTPNMALKRVIMILAASLEFDRRHNSEVIERHTDNEEVPHLIKQLPNLGEKNKERPLCHLYSIKARALLHAHLSRLTLNADSLEKDRQFVVGKCPYLIQEQVNCVNQLIVLAYARRIPKLPSIETIENCMKLCPMIVQGMWEYKSPLLQLPHITDDNLKYFMAKKRQVKTLQQFAQLKGEERRAVLRNMPDNEYENVMKVLGRMPYIDFQVTVEVMDDENPTEVTAGAIVTVTVSLMRKDMGTLFGDETVAESQALTESAGNAQDESAAGAGGDTGADASDAAGTTAAVAAVAKKPAWLKQKKSAGKKSNKKTKKAPVPKATAVVAAASAATATAKPEESPKVSTTSKKSVEESPGKKKDKEDAVDVEDSDDSDASDAEVNEKEDRSSEEEVKSSGVEDDDQEWEKFQNRLQKREKLEGKSKQSHAVHCPWFPEDKQEYWWTYICDRKSRTLLTAPYHVTSLVDREDVQLKFTAPSWPGVYTVTCCLRSDSYLGFDQQRDIKLDVKEAPAEITEHPQWEFDDSEDENKAMEESHESEYTTDEDLPEDDD